MQVPIVLFLLLRIFDMALWIYSLVHAVGKDTKISDFFEYHLTKQLIFFLFPPMSLITSSLQIEGVCSNF